MIIDAHHHLGDKDGYVEELLAVNAELGIDKVCLFGAGRCSQLAGIRGDDAVLAAGRRHPDSIIPFACFDLGLDQPDKVRRAAGEGFKGIKFINPLDNYDARRFYPVYELMESLGLPGIFHTGIVANAPGSKSFDIDNDRHRPIRLDTLARAFPDFKIIGAHLGNPWVDEAAMAARWCPNLYFDLSGSLLKMKSPAQLGQLLWWGPDTKYRDPLKRHAWEKIVFGSDVVPLRRRRRPGRLFQCHGRAASPRRGPGKSHGRHPGGLVGPMNAP